MMRAVAALAAVLVSVLVSTAWASEEESAELVPNGGFELGTLSGWEADGAEPTREQSHSGRWSARLDSRSMRVSVPTRIRGRYKAIAWVKIAADQGRDWGGLRLEASDPEGKSLVHSGWLSQATHGAEWFKVAVGFTATAPHTWLQIGYFGGPKRTMTVYVDDVRALLRDGENRPPSVEANIEPLQIEHLPAQQAFELVGDDADGAIRRVYWDFGDGTRAFTFSGRRRAAQPGRFTATVCAVDDEGAVTRRTVAWSADDPRLPQLYVRTPDASNWTVEQPNVRLSGTASDSVRLVQVTSDRNVIVPAEGTSTWSVEVPLRPGRNRLLIQAHDDQGRVATAERVVRFVPSQPLRVIRLQLSGDPVEQWEPLVLKFELLGSAATHPQLPFDPAPPSGLEWVDGVSVDGLFSPDDWTTVYRRPGFVYQDYQRQPKGQQWLYPQDDAAWMIRFAPPQPGTWRARIEVREAKGTARCQEFSFGVIGPRTAGNHGPVRVSRSDPRYFEYADGSTFPGTGHAISFNAEQFYYDAVRQFETIGPGNQHFFRWWIAGQIWGSAGWPWNSRTLQYEGTVPATGLSTDRAYGDGLASLRLDAQNPIMFQGWMSGHAGLVPGKKYRLRVRWRTEEVEEPLHADEPYGACVKLMGWPEPGATAAVPAVIAHVHGDTPWHVAEGQFTADRDFVPNVVLLLENAARGAAYVDECALYEVRDDGTLGPQLLRTPRANAHLYYDLARGYAMDGIFEEAARRGLCFKLVVSEKQEYLLDHLAPDGLPDPLGGNFFGAEGSPSRRLHEYYWRHLMARFGAYRSLHSWELNDLTGFGEKGDRHHLGEAPSGPFRQMVPVTFVPPEFGEPFRMAAALARMAAEDGNPHPATLSTWATLAQEAWKNAESGPIGYVDFHAYVRGTGWIEPKEELAGDSARLFAEYDRAAAAAAFGKPVVWGEAGIDGPGSTDVEDPALAQDREGVWLHKLLWARLGPGGVYPLYWYTDNIFRHQLHRHFGALNRFLADIPLGNGHYRDLAAEVSSEDLLVLGQKDTQAGRAHVWINNRGHTWRAVVEGREARPVDGTLAIGMEKPDLAYRLTWYDTLTAQPTGEETLFAGPSGRIVLEVRGLKTDVAAKIERK